MSVAVLGAGAFGTALAIALARNGTGVRLWARDGSQVADMQASRQNARHLPGIQLPEGLLVTANIADLDGIDTVLLAVPMQQVARVIADHPGALKARTVVACAKGIDLTTLRGPTALLQAAFPSDVPAILTGPSFAADIARGLPTALTLACADEAQGIRLQGALSTPTLRLYRTTDVTGAELGGALKNVIAIGAGVVSGAGLGDSARAALITRGFAELTRLALHLGAQAETLAGLSGLGDLVLTCTSDQSRNFRYGRALGQGAPWDGTITVEGAATARAVTDLADKAGIDLPVSTMVARLVAGQVGVPEAVAALMSRPLKKE